MSRFYGSPPAIAPNVITALAAAPRGGWTQDQRYHGVVLGDYVYFGYVNGSTGAIEVSGWNFVTRTAVSPITVHAAINSDTHDAPSLLIRASDHALMVWYSGHNGTHLYQRISLNSLDSDPTLAGGFGGEVDLDSSLGGTQYTYPFAGQFADGTIWLGYRDNDGTHTLLCFAKSTDGGATWPAETKMWTRTGFSVLYFYIHFGADRFDMALTNGNGVTGTHISMYHAYWKTGGNPHLSDGTGMVGTEPLDPTNATLVHDGSAYPNGWPTGITDDATGAPVILYETVDTANGHSYVIKYARWNGSSWDKTTVTTLDDTGLVQIVHSALHESGAIAWVVKPVSSVYELFEYVTSDHGATWSETQLTSGSSLPGFLYPANVADPVTAMRGLVLGGGSYVATDDNSVGVYGIGS